MAVPAAYGAMAPPHPPFWGSCSLREGKLPQVGPAGVWRGAFQTRLAPKFKVFLPHHPSFSGRRSRTRVSITDIYAGLALGSPSIQEKSKFRWHIVSIYQFGRCLKNVCILSFNNSILKKLLYMTKINAFLFTVALVMLHKSGNKLHIQRLESG